MEKVCAALCGKMVKFGEGHVYRDGLGRILMYHMGCCPVCPNLTREEDIIPV